MNKTIGLIQRSYSQSEKRNILIRSLAFCIKLGISVANKEQSIWVKPVKVKCEVLILRNDAAKPYVHGNILEV